MVVALYKRNGNYKARASDLRGEKRSDASLAWIVVSSWAWRRHCSNDHPALAQLLPHDRPQVICPNRLHQFLVIHGIVRLGPTELTGVRDDLPAMLQLFQLPRLPMDAPKRH